jgi:hypothetical protein
VKRRQTQPDSTSELSRRLNGAFMRRANADWPDVCKRTKDLATPPWPLRHRVLLVAGVLVLALGACAGSTHVIPWLNRHPAKVKAPPPAPPCRAKNLYVHLFYQTSLNGLEGGVSVVNTGRRACSLAGRPKLALTDPVVKKPRLLEIYTPPEQPSPGSFASLIPRELVRALPPHHSAALHFSWRNWCGPGPAPKTLELRLPSGDRIDLSFASARPSDRGLAPLYSATAPRCFRKRWQTGLRYGPFYPGWTPESVISSYQLETALPLRASIITKGLPTIRKSRGGASYVINRQLFQSGRYADYVRVRRGTVFRFRVALRNTGKRSFRFEKCPLYVQSFPFAGKDSIMQTFVLNCRPVNVIAPGRAAYFAMELPVPADAKPGYTLLSWQLMTRGTEGSTAKMIWVDP